MLSHTQFSLRTAVLITCFKIILLPTPRSYKWSCIIHFLCASPACIFSTPMSTTCPAGLAYHNPNKIWCKIQVMKFLIM